MHEQVAEFGVHIGWRKYLCEFWICYGHTFWVCKPMIMLFCELTSLLDASTFHLWNSACQQLCTYFDFLYAMILGKSDVSIVRSQAEKLRTSGSSS